MLNVVNILYRAVLICTVVWVVAVLLAIYACACVLSSLLYPLFRRL